MGSRFTFTLQTASPFLSPPSLSSFTFIKLLFIKLDSSLSVCYTLGVCGRRVNSLGYMGLGCDLLEKLL